MAVVKAEGIVENGDVFVRRGDGLHLFEKSLVRKREKPAPGKAVPQKALLDSPCNGVRLLVDENGKVTLLED